MKEQVERGLIPDEFFSEYSFNLGGRSSNGPLAVEVLAGQFNTGLSNYAVAHATSGQTNLYNGHPYKYALADSGLLGQIDQYAASLAGKTIDPRTLYYIELSFGDFARRIYPDLRLDRDDMSALADQQIANLTLAVTRLQQLGGRRFLVFSTDWSPWPGFRPGADFFGRFTVDLALIERSDQFLEHVNARLPAAMQELARQLDVRIQVFNYRAFQAEILADPGRFGFREAASPCSGWPYRLDPPCPDPDEHVFWGAYSLTARANRILGKALADQVRWEE